MGFANDNTQQQLPYNADTVFNALTEAARLCDMSVKESDSILRRATIDVGMSLMSWGETVSISINPEGDNSCIVVLNSSLKFSANLTGAQKHQKNFDNLLYSLSKVLRGDTVDVSNTHLQSQGDLNESRLEGINPNFALISVAVIFIVIAAIIFLSRS